MGILQIIELFIMSFYINNKNNNDDGDSENNYIISLQSLLLLPHLCYHHRHNCVSVIMVFNDYLCHTNFYSYFIGIAIVIFIIDLVILFLSLSLILH